MAPVTRNSRVTKVAAPRLPLRNDVMKTGAYLIDDMFAGWRGA